jgi:hypothetical protein
VDAGAYGNEYATAVHEIGHALGFSGGMLAYFRDPVTGSPLTPRDTMGNPMLTTGMDHQSRSAYGSKLLHKSGAQWSAV